MAKTTSKILVKPAKRRPTKKPTSKKRGVKAKARNNAPAPHNLRNRIKDLALQTQKSVQGQFMSQTDALKTKLSSYGIAVDDMKATAKHLEQVLKDLRGREFMKQPGVQALMDRVTKKNVEKANLEAQKLAQKVPRKKKLSIKEKNKQEKLFTALSQSKAEQLGHTVVQAIMKRVEEVRKSLSMTTDNIRRKK